jgi:hypothetical protein
MSFKPGGLKSCLLMRGSAGLGGVVYKAVFRQFMMGYMRACKYSLGVQVND